MRGLYVHLPFCRSKCPYCGFYSETAASDLIGAYLEASIKSASALKNKKFDTVYMGGGTPSSIPSKMLHKFTEKLFSVIDFNGTEFSIEANPESVTEDFISFIKNSSVTRVSLGVQSLNNETLKKLGRIHSADKAREAASMLLKTGVSLNTDMIYDIPDISRKIIIETAQELSSLGCDHISAYSYSSDDTGYLAGFNTDYSMYEDIEAFFNEKGYEKYEISNFAKTGKECLHNILYWTGEEYSGIGAGAHSMLYTEDNCRMRYSYPPDIREYIKDPLKTLGEEKLNAETSLKETIIFGLRMKKGVHVKEAEKRFGKMPLNLLKNIDRYIKLGLLEWHSEYLRTTKRGASVLDYLSSCLWA